MKGKTKQKCIRHEAAMNNDTKESKLIAKVKAGHFVCFQDLFDEVTSPYSDFFGVDPYPIWEVAHEHGKD